MPQIYKNYQLKSASGLSIYFLGIWLLGDSSNLLGAILTRQAAWQVVVAGYYVSVDIGLVSQYIWYIHLQSPRKRGTLENTSETNGPGAGSGQVVVDILPSDGSSIASADTKDGKSDTKAMDTPTKPRDIQGPARDISSSFSKEKEKLGWGSFPYPSEHHGTPSFGPSPKALLLVSTLCVGLSNASPLYLQSKDTSNTLFSSESIGRILSWCSTGCYLGSRLPQIYRNAHRRSTAGLSPILFIAAFFGNLFYSSSLLANPLAWDSYPPYGLHGWVDSEGSDRATWITLAAPFWIGAAGVLALDATVGVQFLMYGEGDVEKSVLGQDHKGKIRWRRVRGWMRGWVPSPGWVPSRIHSPSNGEVDGNVRQSLLDGRESRSSHYGAVSTGS